MSKNILKKDQSIRLLFILAIKSEMKGKLEIKTYCSSIQYVSIKTNIKNKNAKNNHDWMSKGKTRKIVYLKVSDENGFKKISLFFFSFSSFLLCLRRYKNESFLRRLGNVSHHLFSFLNNR